MITKYKIIELNFKQKKRNEWGKKIHCILSILTYDYFFFIFIQTEKMELRSKILLKLTKGTNVQKFTLEFILWLMMNLSRRWFCCLLFLFVFVSSSFPSVMCFFFFLVRIEISWIIIYWMKRLNSYIIT